MKLIHKIQSKKINYYVLYSLTFVAIMTMIVVGYIANGRVFVSTGDGYRQRLRAMTFYSQYLRTIVKTLINEHRIVIPDWSFSIGQGGDVLGTLQYFAEIGDPMATLCALIPKDFLPYFYSLVVIVRLYLAGLLFSILCRYKGYLNNLAVLSGSMIYVFCGWSFVNFSRYPHWLFPLVYFPFIMLGVEMVIEKKRPYVLSVAVMFCAMSNFYYFYIVVMLTVLYVALRLLLLYKKDFKSIFVTIVPIGAFSASGVLMAAGIVFPMLYAFTNDARGSVDYLIHAFFNRAYYSGMFASLISNSGTDEQFMTSIFGLVAVVFLFINTKKYEKLIYKFFFAFFICMMCFPIFGCILNGFTYSINRWSWGLSFLEAFILVDQWDDLMKLRVKHALEISMFLLAYACVCLLCVKSRTTVAFASIMIGLIGVIVLFPVENGEKNCISKNKELVFSGAILLSILIMLIFRNISVSGEFIGSGNDISFIRDNFDNTEIAAVKNAQMIDGGDNLYRYAGEGVEYNAQINSDISGTNYYWSISNPNVVKLREKLGIYDNYIFRYFNSESRTILNTLEAVRYYVVNETSLKFPYGFDYVNTIDVKDSVVKKYQESMRMDMGVEELDSSLKAKIWNYQNKTFDVYRNNNALPIVYAYDNYIDEKQWDELSFIQRQDAMLNGIVMSETPQFVKRGEILTASKSVPYTIKNSEELFFVDENTIVTTKENQEIVFEFNGNPNSENYLVFKGFDYTNTNIGVLYSDDISVDPLNMYNQTMLDIKSSDEVNKIRSQSKYYERTDSVVLKVSSSSDYSNSLEYHTSEYDHYTGRHDFAINAGFSKEPIEYIKLTLEGVGTYKVDGFEVVCESMEGYEDAVGKLKSGGVVDITMDTDILSGTVDAPVDEMLCIALPYSEGFKAYIDGIETKLYNGNVEYMAIEMPKGQHAFELRYKTPYKKIGFAVSVVSMLCYIAFVLINERSLKRKNKGEA